MKRVTLAITSDLHLPITPITMIAAVAREVQSIAPDALIIAGDVAESLGELVRCLDTFKLFVACPVLVLAGNHDLWRRSASSRLLWEKLLPETVRKAGCVWLEGNSFICGEVAVAGTIAWYDYSAIDPSIQATPEEIARNKSYFNVDADMIDWEWTDREFAVRVAQPFLATLDRLEQDPSVRQTVVVTHVPLVEEQMCRKPGDRDWGYSNAYFGNLTLGREVLGRKKVTHIISGHTHVARRALIEMGDGRMIDARVIDSEYSAPGWVALTLGSEGEAGKLDSS